MPKVSEKNIYRVIDANVNRMKEGLRVCEDVSRFVLDNKKITGELKDIRHLTTKTIGRFGKNRLMDSRNIEGDVGRRTAAAELKRRGVPDIFFANMQRSKESMRVLEEFAKLKNSRSAKDFKKLRYRLYAIEKKVASRL